MSEPTPEEELMPRDALEDLLDASAPAQPIDKRDVRAMVADARWEVRAAPRGKRAAAITGALALLMAGGAGVATAADYFDWASLANPVGTYTFQDSGGATCDVVFGDVRIVDRSDRERRDQIERDLRSWFDNTDVVDIAIAEVDEYLPRAEQMTHPRVEDPVELAYRTAIDMSVSDQAMAELDRLGYAEEVAAYGSVSNCAELDN